MRITKSLPFACNFNVSFKALDYSSSGKLPDWKRMNLDDMSSLKVIDETFFTKPSSLDNYHSSWDEILAIVNSQIYL